MAGRAIRWFYRTFAQPHNSCVRHRDGAIRRFYGGGSLEGFKKGTRGMDSSADYLEFSDLFEPLPFFFFPLSTVIILCDETEDGLLEFPFPDVRNSHTDGGLWIFFFFWCLGLDPGFFFFL